ncbi:hypothetical protein [Dryocola sp. BD626]|uniref:hypothetical protein n=1 Tax=Dryocola sp. BD626 TaxID=3133273 RepID=UPI003F4FEC3A
MAEIYFDSYSGSDELKFYADLDNKDEVLFLTYQNDLVGFTTLQYSCNENTTIIYSGDTIVIPEHWKQQVLYKTWIMRMALLKQDNPSLILYWLLLVKGIRTYKYLKVFTKKFHPNWNTPEPELKHLADSLAQQKFGSLYNPETGVVECPEHFGYLKAPLADIVPTLQTKPEVAFFLQKNPNYSRGHELVCLCEISPDNLSDRCRSFFEKPHVEFRNE